MSSQTFDIFSYLANLQGNLTLVNQQLSQNQTLLNNARTQSPDIYQQLVNAGKQSGPNGPSADQANAVQTLGSQYQALQNQISQYGSKISDLTNEQNALNAQIQAATDISKTIPRATGITDTIASTPSTGLNLSSLKLPDLSNVSPILLIGGAALLILILK